MVRREEIVAKAREFIGTPYEHQGRLKGVGIDCCGLIICVAHELGLSNYNVGQYSRWADGVDLLREFEEQCQPVIDWQPGDILIFEIGRVPRHCGIVGSTTDGNLTLIHSLASIKRCVEHNLDRAWSDRIVRSFSFPQQK